MRDGNYNFQRKFDPRRCRSDETEEEERESIFVHFFRLLGDLIQITSAIIFTRHATGSPHQSYRVLSIDKCEHYAAISKAFPHF